MTVAGNLETKIGVAQKKSMAKLLSSASTLVAGATIMFVTFSSQSAMAQTRNGTVGEPTSPVNITTSDFGGNVDTDALEKEISGITGNLTISRENREARIRQAITNATGGTSGPCQDQLDPIINAFDIAGASVDLAGIVAEGVTGGAFLASIPGIALQGVGTGLSLGSAITASTQLSLPGCEARFTGTIKGDADLVTSLGIQAFNGELTLGNPDGITFSEGIAIGGGSVSGAGQGALATTGTLSSIAIGNGSVAQNDASLAIGNGAGSLATAATAIGANSRATAIDCAW